MHRWWLKISFIVIIIPMLSLTPSQQKAIETLSRGVLVIAGPGSGKTRTIVARLLYLLENGVTAERIATVTFTQKAAYEIKHRLKEMDRDTEKLFIGTIHALAKDLLEQTGLSFEIAEEETIVQILKETGIDDPQKALQELSLKRNLCQTDPSRDVLINTLKAVGQIDFEGLLELAIETFSEKPLMRFDHILIDEIQDLTPLQFKFIRAICHEHTMVFGVGDDDQSIYGFRGSRPELMMLFSEVFSPCKTVVLRENFRNPAPVYHLAQAVISPLRNRLQKEIVPAKTGTNKPRLVQLETPAQEASYIAREIIRLLGGTGYHDLSTTDIHRSPSEFCVLVRTKHLFGYIQKALEKEGLPVYTVSEEQALKQEQLKSLLEWIEVFSSEQNLESLSAEQIVEKVTEQCTLESLKNYIHDIGFGIKKLSASEALFRLKEELKFLTGADLIGTSHEAVHVMTIHASKGLEFPFVFIAGCQQGLIPLSMDNLTPALEEERRLLYVAITRTKEQLTITYSKRRSLFGKRLPGSPSLFLSPLQEYYQKVTPERPNRKVYQKGLF